MQSWEPQRRQPLKQVLEVGMTANCMYGEDGSFPGCIHSVKDDGSATFHFDDGDVLKNVKIEMLIDIVRPKKSTKKSKNTKVEKIEKGDEEEVVGDSELPVDENASKKEKKVATGKKKTPVPRKKKALSSIQA